MISFEELVVGDYELAELMNLMVVPSKEIEGPEICGLPQFKFCIKNIYPFADHFLQRFKGEL